MFERLHTDRGVIQRVLRGHQDSFRVLVDRYGAMIYGVAYAHVGNAQDAEDAVQEAFIRLYEWLDRLNKKESVAAWLVRVVRNIAVDILRRRSRETALEDAPDSSSAVCANPARAEIRRLVWEQMSALDPADREILVLYYFRSRRAKEIAQILDITPQAAAKRLQRARMELGRRLESVAGEEFGAAKDDPARTKRIMAAVAAAPTAWKASASLALSGALVTGSTFTKAVTGLTACMLIALAGFFGWRYYSRPYSTQDIKAQSTSSTEEAPTATLTGNPAANTNTAKNANVPNKAPSSVPDSVEPALYEPATHTSVCGEVVMEDGEPVPNVPVVLYGEEGIMPFTGLDPESPSVEMTQVSDKNGQFRFDAVPSELSGVRVSAQWGSLYGERLLNRDPTLKEIYLELTLAPDASLQFRLTDEANSPIVASIDNAWVTNHDSFPRLSRSVAGGFPDEDGWVRYPHLPKGKYRFEITSDSFEPFITPWIDTDTPNLAFRLKRKIAGRGSSISGIVIDAAGRPMAGLYVTAEAESSRARSESGAEGTFRIVSLAAGSYDLVVSSKRCEQDPAYVLKDPVKVTLSLDQSVTDLRLTVVPGVKVSGNVVDGQTREPMPFTRLLVMDKARPVSSAVADKRGAFTLTGMRPGDYGVQLSAIGIYRQVETRLTIPSWAPLDNAVLVFSLPTACRGVVVDAQDKPVPGAVVVFAPSGARDTPGAVLTDSLGRFCVATEKKSALHLQASADGRLSRRVGPVEAHSTGHRLELLGAARIEGAVVDRNGMPLPQGSVVAAVSTDATVYNMDFAVGERNAGIVGMKTFTKPSGYFTFHSVLPGQYQLDVYPATGSPDVPVNSTAVSVSEGQTLETRLIVDRSQCGSICGTVTIDGRPVEHIRVSASGKTWVSTNNAAFTDSAGRYVFPCVMPGAVDVAVQVFFDGAEDVSNNVQSVDVLAGDTKTIDFPLTTGRGAIKGNVYLNGEPWRCMNSILVEPTPASEGKSILKTQTDQEGSFCVSGLPGGTYTIQCLLGDAVCTSSIVELGESQTQQVDLHVLSGMIHGRVTGGGPGQQVVVLLLPGEVSVASFSPETLAQLEGSVLDTRELDKRGEFEFERLPGLYLVGAVAMPADTTLDSDSVLPSLQAGRFAYADVAVAPGQTTEIQLTIAP